MFLCDIIFPTFLSNVLIVAFQFKHSIENILIIDNISVVYIYNIDIYVYTYNISICLCVWNFHSSVYFIAEWRKQKMSLEMFNVWYVGMSVVVDSISVYDLATEFGITNSNPHILKTINVSPPQMKSTGKCNNNNNNFFFHFNI